MAVRGNCDFVVKHDPSTESGYELLKKIMYSIIVKPLRHNKPRTIFMSGDSGEGKSMSGVFLEQVLAEIQGIDLNENFDLINVFTPFEYPKKMDKILFSKEETQKKVNIITIHEAREVVKAALWKNFITQAVADINAMSRQIKPMCVIIISQFIRNITTEMRYTLNYYVKVSRPVGKKARLAWYVMWKDDSDLEKPRLKKRRLAGYIVMPNGKYKKYVPKYIEIPMPDKELKDRFNELDFNAKSSIIKGKIERMISEMEKEAGVLSNKIQAMVEWYAKNPSLLSQIGKRNKKGWKILPRIRELHNLTEEETKRFEIMLNKKLEEKGGIVLDEPQDTQDKTVKISETGYDKELEQMEAIEDEQ